MILYMREFIKSTNVWNGSFWIRKWKFICIVNYLDNEGVAGITVLGDATNITAQTVVVRTYKQPTIVQDIIL